MYDVDRMRDWEKEERMLIFNMILIEVSTSVKHQTKFRDGNTLEETSLYENTLHDFVYDDKRVNDM